MSSDQFPHKQNNSLTMSNGESSEQNDRQARLSSIFPDRTVISVFYHRRRFFNSTGSGWGFLGVTVPDRETQAPRGALINHVLNTSALRVSVQIP